MEMNLDEFARLLGFSSEWFKLGIITNGMLEIMQTEYDLAEDKHPEHYRWRAFDHFLKSTKLSEEQVIDLYNLVKADPDRAMADSMINRILSQYEWFSEPLDSKDKECIAKQYSEAERDNLRLAVLKKFYSLDDPTPEQLEAMMENFGLVFELSKPCQIPAYTTNGKIVTNKEKVIYYISLAKQGRKWPDPRIVSVAGTIEPVDWETIKDLDLKQTFALTKHDPKFDYQIICFSYALSKIFPDLPGLSQHSVTQEQVEEYIRISYQKAEEYLSTYPCNRLIPGAILPKPKETKADDHPASCIVLTSYYMLPAYIVAGEGVFTERYICCFRCEHCKARWSIVATTDTHESLRQAYKYSEIEDTKDEHDYAGLVAYSLYRHAPHELVKGSVMQVAYYLFEELLAEKFSKDKAQAGPAWVDIAKSAYQAYGATTDNKNHLGKEMPAWEDLPDGIKIAWEAAVRHAGNIVATGYIGDPNIWRGWKGGRR